MARLKYKPAGILAGRTPRTLREQRFDQIHSNTVTMGVGIPRRADGQVGDITVRAISKKGDRCYIKTNGGWRDINAMIEGNNVEWTPMNLVNSWARYHATTHDLPAFWKSPHGIVHLKGSVKDGSAADAVICTLPEGYRPKFDTTRLILDTTGLVQSHRALLKIATNGEISLPNSGVTTGAHLDGVFFFAGIPVEAQAPTQETRLDTQAADGNIF